jgi:hypothetical protein
MTASVPIVYVEPIEEPAASPAIAQADSDAQLVALWIGRHASPHTRRNYQRGRRAVMVQNQSPRSGPCGI